MDLHLLPHYRGLTDSPSTWGEPDERGQLPRLRLRDYVVLSLLLALFLPIVLGLAVNTWFYHRRLAALNEARSKEVQVWSARGSTIYLGKCPHRACDYFGIVLPVDHQEAQGDALPGPLERRFSCPRCGTEWEARVARDNPVWLALPGEDWPAKE
jgi:hypothetical protein